MVYLCIVKNLRNYIDQLTGITRANIGGGVSFPHTSSDVLHKNIGSFFPISSVTDYIELELTMGGTVKQRSLCLRLPFTYLRKKVLALAKLTTSDLILVCRCRKEVDIILRSSTCMVQGRVS